MKTPKQLERYFKGVANHWRIEILLLIQHKPEITLAQIAYELSGNLKTISEHTRRLVEAGLVRKKYRGREVAHTLTPYGTKLSEFVKRF